MTTKHASTWFLCLALALPALGCDGGDDEGDSPGDSGGTGEPADPEETGMQQGFTDCTPMGLEDTPTTCQPGQYCSDPNFADCFEGCLSNVNCAADQSCSIPAGESVGNCVNEAPAISEEAFCMKLLTCDPTGTMELCSQVYAGTNAECHACIAAENCGDINDFEGVCDAACGLG